MNSSSGALEILAVEDNPGDVRLMREALKQGKLLHHLSVVEDGEAAIEFLYQRGAHAHAPRPNLILLDLNLPKKDGREVLATIKSDTALKTIPVVILTSSRAEEDILRAYKLEANCYITKPVDLQRFFEIVKSIEEFWLTVVTLPPK